MGKLDGYKKDQLVAMLRDMLTIRRFEEKVAQAYGLKKIGGFCHLYNGQESVVVGAVAALDMKKDYLLTAYRDHGHALATGMDPKVIMAELFAKEAGCSRGKGGSMHMFDVEKHMLGGNGIVGGQIPVATGVAFMQMYKKTKGVTLCFFGDGAIHQGAFHESANLASIWNLPVIYIVENNHFGMGTAVKRVSAVEDFDVKAKGYNMTGTTVDGMDVIEVRKAIKKAAETARKEGRPALLDLKTYRYKGHSMSDPAKYRTKEELEEFKQQDPILLLKKDLLDAEMITEKKFEELDKEAKAVAKQAEEFAEESPEPPLESRFEDIYA